MRIRKNSTRLGIAAAVSAFAIAMSGGTAQASTTAPTIGDGYANNGNAVWCIQHSLNWARNIHQIPWEPTWPEIAEDGKWGPSTKAAVVAFQRNYDWMVTPDGYVGPETGSVLLPLGEGYYNGTAAKPGYCYQYIPTKA
ncbi:peptidoglycan-binding domain-containing protein [Streptomyces laurentii]|uniref:peptidoglycan-binding domain-containing protein n=1 Tax=Streptomyces laurentii TaxID=39478 RepID=UPI0036AD21D2